MQGTIWQFADEGGVFDFVVFLIIYCNHEYRTIGRRKPESLSSGTRRIAIALRSGSLSCPISSKQALTLAPSIRFPALEDELERGEPLIVADLGAICCPDAHRQGSRLIKRDGVQTPARVRQHKPRVPVTEASLLDNREFAVEDR